MDEIYVANPKLPAATVRNICGSMMFTGDSAEKKISLLSGGEKSRVMLGQIIAREVNILFLDEPTNHLDMDSIDALTTAIKNFNGSAIIVTHSEELLRQVCDRLIIFAKDGAEYFDGNYDDFLEKIGWEEEVISQPNSTKQIENSEPKVNKKENKKLRSGLIQERNKLTSPLKKEVDKLESSIMQKEEELESYHNELIAASNAGDNSKIMDISRLVTTLEKEVEEKFELLEEKQTSLDEITEEYDIKLEGL